MGFCGNFPCTGFSEVQNPSGTRSCLLMFLSLPVTFQEHLQEAPKDP
jgi:hypothetical protein